MLTSYQQTSRVKEFIPGYTPHSDLLPQNPVLEVGEDDRIQIVHLKIFSSETSMMTEENGVLPQLNPHNLMPKDTFLTKYSRM